MALKETNRRGDEKERSDRAAELHPYDPVSLTVASQAEDNDLNVLMKRFGITGKMPENPRVPMYGDFTEITDYRSALDAIRQANENFAEFPADVRARFNNDPQQLLEFMENPANRAEGERLGLLKVVHNPPVGAPVPQPQPADQGGNPPSGTPKTA